MSATIAADPGEGVRGHYDIATRTQDYCLVGDQRRLFAFGKESFVAVVKGESRFQTPADSTPIRLFLRLLPMTRYAKAPS